MWYVQKAFEYAISVGIFWFFFRYFPWSIFGRPKVEPQKSGMRNLTIGDDGSAVLDISLDSKDPGLMSRRLWEALFRVAEIDDIRSLDSFLCDLYTFRNMFAERQIPFTMWWDCDNVLDWTNIVFDPFLADLSFTDKIFRVDVTREKIIIMPYKRSE